MNAVHTSTDIRSLLKLALPIGSRLVTGYPATQVSRVSHLNNRLPLFADISGDELILVSTPGLAAQRQAVSLESVIEKLTQTQASALGVQGTITPRTQQIARDFNFPLIMLPDRVVLPQVERAVRRLLTERGIQLEHRALELQQILQRHAAGRRGLSTILNTIARMLDRPVVVHDRYGKVLSRGIPALHGHDWDSHEALTGGAEFIRRFDLDDRAFYEDDWQVISSPAGLTAPLIHDGRLIGYISALSAGDQPDDFDLLALEYSVSTVTREVARQQTIDLGIEPVRAKHDWITDWLTNPAADDALLALRAAKDNFQAGVWYAVVLFQWTGGSHRANAGFSPDRMVKMVQSELRQRRIQAPVGQYIDRAVVFFPLDEPQQTQRLKQMVGMLRDLLLRAVPDGTVTAGVGRPAMGLTALRESFQEAERALALPDQLHDETPVAFFGDLSLYELLLGVSDPASLADFCTHWLSSLIRYDEQHHTDLLMTLNAYFENNGNMARTAHLLNIHRNTLVYRLGRITEILQLDMDDSNVRLNLHLALKINCLLNTF